MSITDSEKIIQVWKPYKHLWQRIEVPAKTVLLKCGNVCNKFYHIERGSVRLWFEHGDKEISFRFFFEDDAVCDIESFRQSVPSVYNIETIEPCVLWQIDKKTFDKVVEENPSLHEYMLNWAVEKQSAYIRHFFSLLKDMPQERYKTLLRENRRIIQRVPLQYIASYLGITPVSLSRIRNKMQ